jgi:hypothetical protein
MSKVLRARDRLHLQRNREQTSEGTRPHMRQCLILNYTRRKYADLKLRMTAHEELFDMLRTMPDADAHEVLQRIKAGLQPDDILRLIRDGNLLMQ